MENKMRSSLNEIYFGKTKDIVNDVRFVYGPRSIFDPFALIDPYANIRSVESLMAERSKMQKQKDIAAALAGRAKKV
jgi:hypothetical protein